MERLYTEEASWWPLLSPPDTYEEEGPLYFGWLTYLFGRAPKSLMELGSGGGHLAQHYPSECEVLLVDLSEPMLEVSRHLNPNKSHVCGDMRSLRLGRTVESVLIHDAIMYMTSREDVVATLRTAFEHLVPGGPLVVIPDVIQETFWERTVTGGNGNEDRAIQLMEWHWDPDTSDETFCVEFCYLLREGQNVRSVHEQHKMGLFGFQVWIDMLNEAGFEVVPRGLDHMSDCGGEVFWARRPLKDYSLR